MRGCEAVVHAAAMVGFAPGMRPRQREINVEGTRHVLEAARAPACGVSCTRRRSRRSGARPPAASPTRTTRYDWPPGLGLQRVEARLRAARAARRRARDGVPEPVAGLRPGRGLQAHAAAVPPGQVGPLAAGAAGRDHAVRRARRGRGARRGADPGRAGRALHPRRAAPDVPRSWRRRSPRSPTARGRSPRCRRRSLRVAALPVAALARARRAAAVQRGQRWPISATTATTRRRAPRPRSAIARAPRRETLADAARWFTSQALLSVPSRNSRHSAAAHPRPLRAPRYFRYRGRRDSRSGRRHPGAREFRLGH